MKVLIVNQSEVAQLLSMSECMIVMADALKALARGEAIQPLRPIMRLPEKVGLLGIMPGYLDSLKSLGLKVISIFPGNQNTEYDSHQGAVLLFEAKHGQLLSIMDASSVTAIRTAAVSGVATQLLARDDAADLVILGSGVQAQTHLEAMLLARKIKRVRVWSRSFANAQKFAERESQKHKIAVEPMKTAQEAVTNADIICTVTSSSQPVLFGEWIAPGAHINAVGSSTPNARELDTPAIVRATLFVDRRESTLNEAGDFLVPQNEGAIEDDHIRGELGGILLGHLKGRVSDQEITLFKSLGLAVEDIAATHYIYHKALEKKKGTWIELGGARHL
ncbi:ornithine cyclodeaminase family protein [Candidatus Acetothermia bacterium]|nr:ornithine cyclodeaminase family protein [Candidatus Acetothermia bacterium]MBI3460673.1 ornithine cyclodeaminase family protein [Candidatus Acetothermia bacterium]MBI3661189.1 ornithine cyclodeaminase family protein [Candidatus Acetothermia bacterium]